MPNENCRVGESNAADDVGEVEPNFHTAVVRALGADGGSDIGAEVARGTYVFGDLRVDFA